MMTFKEFNNSDRDSISIEERAQRLFEQHLTIEDVKPDVDGLKSFVESCGGKWQALTPETLLHFHCRHVEKWLPPFVRAHNTSENIATVTPLPCMIIPADTSIQRANYIAQLTCPLDSLSGKEREHIKPKMHVGIEKTLFNVEAFTSDAKIIPVVESADAAMSIWQATNGTVSAVALTSFEIRAAGKKKLLTAINEIKPVGKRFLILLDGDPTGRVAAGNLLIDLLKIYVPAAARYFDDFLDTEDKKICVDAPKGRINANSILRVKGDKFLRDLIARITADAEKDFVRAEKEIADAQAKAARIALTDEQYFFLFDGDTSDKDFAKRMEYLFGDQIRWHTDNLSWLIFDRNKHGGGVWKNKGSQNSQVFPFAYNLSDRLEANAKKDKEHDKKIAHAFKKTDKFSATFGMMKSLDSIRITASDVDKNPELLNVLNGVVNLESGELYPTVDPSLILTKQANAVYRGKDFHSETVDNFLTGIQPNAETRAALLRYLGYGAAGLIRDHIFQIWRGDGRNGKSTLLALTAETLGSYCVTLAKSAVLDNGKTDDPNAPTPALTVLEGARLAIIPELSRTAKINTALMKHLCAGDPLPIRQLHCEQRTIKPVAKYILNGNYLPSVDDVNDFGLNERIRNVPFNQTFTGERADPRLLEKLSTDEARAAMLSILVAEAQAWYRDGLIESAEMVAAKDAFVAANDFISEFVSENCEVGKGGFIEISNFIEAIQDNSDEAKKTPKRILKDMVKKALDGKNGVVYKLHPNTRRAGLSGIHWLV